MLFRVRNILFLFLFLFPLRKTVYCKVQGGERLIEQNQWKREASDGYPIPSLDLPNNN